MDPVTKYNIERWNALVKANALFTRPAANLDRARAQEMVDPEGRLGALAGKKVLCLACGGGQQSIAFTMLGAKATVVDLSPAQLQRDADAAASYGYEVEIIQGDMRDLSALPESAYDIVYHAYSLGFVPQAEVVFRQVARVLRPGGIYHFGCANPFYLGMTEDSWTGAGYLLRHPYVQGEEITYADQEWVYNRDEHKEPINGPREYRHTLSALITGLVAANFILLALSDDAFIYPNPNAGAGTWDHFVAYAPPWLHFWATYRPDIALSIPADTPLP